MGSRYQYAFPSRLDRCFAASLGELTLPQVTATTDFETHRLWVNQPCEHYYTATEEGARYLQHWGIPAGQTTVTGIPIHPVFAKRKDRTECLARLGLAGDRPIVLQFPAVSVSARSPSSTRASAGSFAAH